MSEVDYGAAIASTRKTTSAIIANALENLEGKSEVDTRDEILKELSQHDELYPTGWYDPPPGGVSVLFADAPYERLKFDTLRNETYWPSDEIRFHPESVGGIVYLSSVDKATGIIGDLGVSIYTGANEKIRTHLKTALRLVLDVTERAEIGMKFSDLYAFAMDYFKKSGKTVKWMTTYHDPLKVNLGHTIPGSLPGDDHPSGSFDDVKEFIRSKRVYINEVESFVIPPTCAFTLEARLTDFDGLLPNVFFHVIVVISDGRKQVITDVEPIFRTVGMNYML